MMFIAEEVEFIDTEAKATALKDKVKAFEEDIALVSQIKKFNIKDLPRLHFEKAFPDEIGKVAKIMGGIERLIRTR